MDRQSPRFRKLGFEFLEDRVVLDGTQLPLDEGAGTVAGDVSGGGNDGTLVNGAAFDHSSGDGSTYSVRFDGVDDRIDLGPLDLNGTGLTLAAWFNADSYPGDLKDPRLISKASSTSLHDHVFMLSTIAVDQGTNIRLRGRIRVGGVTTTLIASSGNLTTGVWSHAALTHDGTTMRLYLNGVEVGSRALAGLVDTSPSVDVAIGSQPFDAGPRFFDGRIDAVDIRSRALSANEINEILQGTPPVIDVWQGLNQTFGDVGVPQVWVNVLGNVYDENGIASLEYRLNDPLQLSPATSLTLGPDGRRLESSGDFNIDLSVDDLLEGLNKLEITATDTLNNSTVVLVDVHFAGNNSWPINDTIDWSSVSSIQERVQIVDGDWQLNGDTLTSPQIAGYDRGFAIGDVGWTDFEVTVPITIQSLDLGNPNNLCNCNGIGFALRWQGHSVWDDAQPAWGYFPFGALAFYRNDGSAGTSQRLWLASNEYTQGGSGTIVQDTSGKMLQIGVPYIFKGRAETLASGSSEFSFKVWEEGQIEPPWDLTIETSGDIHFPAGSILFLSHYVNATFGDIVVTGENHSPTATRLTQLHSYAPGTAAVALDDIVVTDADVGETITARLVLNNVATGSLSSGTFGATTSTYDSNLGLWEATGSVTDVNAALAAVAFVPITGNNVDTTITTHIEDQAGAGPADGTITLDVRASELLVRLTLDEGSGNVAADVSGNGNDGTLIGGATFLASSGDGSSSSVRFDGVSGTIDLGPLDVNSTGLTLAAWFRADSFPGELNDARLISKATGIFENEHVFMLSTWKVGEETRLRSRIRIGGVVTTLVSGSGTVSREIWQHAAVTYDGLTLRLYLDGVEVGSTPLSGAVDTDPTVDVAVGGQPAGAGERFWDGSIDDVRIYQIGLSAGEVANIVSGSVNRTADFDSDGDVDGFDFLVWQQGFGITSPNASIADGDADDDQDVDVDDLGIWEGQFGNGVHPMFATTRRARNEPFPTEIVSPSHAFEPIVAAEVRDAAMVLAASSTSIWRSDPIASDEEQVLFETNMAPTLSRVGISPRSEFTSLPTAKTISLAEADQALVEWSNDIVLDSSIEQALG